MDKKLEPIIESFNVEEEYLYEGMYNFLKGVATALKYRNTLIALPLARTIHNGQYRKGMAKFNGKKVKLPYFVHCLKVATTLSSTPLPLTDEEMDILYATALLHDSVEERPDLFPKGGDELYEDHGISMEVVKRVKLLTKTSGLDEYGLNIYFNNVKKDKITLLVKLADRSHNVEDLYNMKNMAKYIDETRRYFIENGLCAYGKNHYPELSQCITFLKGKILSLIEEAEYYEEKLHIENEEHKKQLAEKDAEIERLKKELELLRGDT